MASSFPSSLDAFTNPSSTDAMDSVSVPHATQHADLNDAVVALEAKVGADSSAVTSSHDYKIAQLEAISHGKILQVVSATKTDVFSTSSLTLVDITGLSVSITPSDASNTILVHYVANASNNGVNDGGAVQLVRDSTAIFQSTAGSTNFSSAFTKQLDTALIWAFSGMHLDSPATTSATTYKLQARRLGSNNFLLNRPGATTTYGVASSITVMEIGA
jgi:hypothetical protein